MTDNKHIHKKQKCSCNDTTIPNIIPDFDLTETGSMKDNVFIKTTITGQYLIVGSMMFEIGASVTRSPVYNTYYIHPTTLEVGHVYSYTDSCMDTTYHFKTKSYNTSECWHYNEIYERIEKKGFLKVGRLIINGNPWIERLSDHDIHVILNAFRWLEEKSNESAYYFYRDGN